ncbi:hypothetical protein [Pedobacter panaciterrae]
MKRKLLLLAMFLGLQYAAVAQTKKYRVKLSMPPQNNLWRVLVLLLQTPGREQVQMRKVRLP